MDNLVEDEQAQILQLTVAAIGAFEEDEQGNITYAKGDECIECLVDLIRAIKRDEEAASGVIHLLGVWKVLQDHLVPILHTYQDNEMLIRAAIRLMVYLTKPTAPWKEDRIRQLNYMQAQKLSLLDGATLDIFVGMLVNAIAVPAAERPPAALELMANLLQLLRNLALVPDVPIEQTKKADGGRIEPAGLQDLLVERYKQHGVLDVVLTLASAIEDEKASKLQVDHLILELLYLLFLRSTPDDVAAATADPSRSAAKAAESLSASLQRERQRPSDLSHGQRGAQQNARHSRFGGSFLRKSETGKLAVVTKPLTVLRSGDLDLSKKARTKVVLKKNVMESMYVNESQLSMRALAALQEVADEFLISGYHPLMQHLLKRFATTVGTHEKDITLYLWMASYFLRYFNLRRHEQLRLAGSVKSEESAAESRPMPAWSFGLVGTSLELDTLRYVILKVRTEYMVAETKNWANAHIGVKCLREALSVIEGMAKDPAEATRDAADHVLHNLFYENQLLDLTLELWRELTQQPRAYIVSLIELTDILVRLLESYTKQKPLFVQTKRRKSRKRKQEDGNQAGANQEVDDEEEEGADEDQMAEKKFEFETYITRFASDHLITAYVEMLETLHTNGDAINHMIVRLLHRFFVTLNLQGFFYKLRLFDVFNRILQQPTIEKSHPEVHQLIKYITRCFFKRLKEYPALPLELLFPKTVRDSQFIQFGEQGAKGKAGDSAKGGADAAGAGGKAKSTDDGPALVPLKPGAFDNMSDDENEGGGGGGGDEEGREAPAAPLKASSVEIRMELPRDRMVHALILYLQEHSHTDDLVWLRRVLDDSVNVATVATVAPPPAGDGDVEVAEVSTDNTEAPATDLVPGEEAQWAAVNNPYFRLLLVALGFSSPSKEHALWRLPAAPRTARKELAELVGELMYAPAPTDPPLPSWDDLFYDRAALAERARERVRLLKKARRSRKRAEASAADAAEGADGGEPKRRRRRRKAVQDDDDDDDDNENDVDKNKDSDGDDGAGDDADGASDADAPSAKAPRRQRKRRVAEDDSDGEDRPAKAKTRAPKRSRKAGSATASQGDGDKENDGDADGATASQRARRAPPKKALLPRQMPDEIASSDLDDDNNDNNIDDVLASGTAPTVSPVTASDPRVPKRASGVGAPESSDGDGSEGETTPVKRHRSKDDDDDDNDEDEDNDDEDSDGDDRGLTIAPMAGSVERRPVSESSGTVHASA